MLQPSHGRRLPRLIALRGGSRSYARTMLTPSSDSCTVYTGESMIQPKRHMSSWHFSFGKEAFFCMRFLQPMVPFVTLFFGSDEWSSSSTKQPEHAVFPGQPCNVTLKTEGRALPQGAINGAIPRFSIDELFDFGELLIGGCSKHLASWEFPI